MKSNGLKEASLGTKLVEAKEIPADEIPAELFQILKDDAIELLHSIC